MNRLIRIVVVALLLPLPLMASTYVVKAVKGMVEVRHGVSEEWRALKGGELLKPEDTMRTGKKSSATITLDGKTLTIPEQTMVDLSDFRQMTQEEFLLKLAMENILAVPPRENGPMAIPRTTILHGSEVEREKASGMPNTEEGIMQLQGAKLLYDHAYYATSILKTKETLRLFPDLQGDTNARLRMARAFEQLKLTNEALAEYSTLLNETLPETQRALIQSSIQRLRALQSRQ
jgi:hypothetical protein